MHVPQIKEHPPAGCYITGPSLVGAKWDSEAKCLAEPERKQLLNKTCVIWLCPILCSTCSNSIGDIESQIAPSSKQRLEMVRNAET